jgi:GntR family transcriptional repressor for pyruvate dehydrogenase complex
MDLKLIAIFAYKNSVEGEGIFVQVKPIRQVKIYEEVRDALEQMIRDGELKPGDKLDSVQQLAEKFQVGRSAVREALTALKAMGLVEMRHGEGTFIREFVPDQIAASLSTAILMDKKDIMNLLEVRKIIEAGTVVAAAEKANEEDLLDISEALQKMREFDGDEELGEKADLQFHLAIAKAAHNPLLVSLMDHVSGMIVDAMRETRKLLLYSNPAKMEKLFAEHLAIFEAIREHDQEKARKVMLKHLENVDATIRRGLQ